MGFRSLGHRRTGYHSLLLHKSYLSTVTDLESITVIITCSFCPAFDLRFDINNKGELHVTGSCRNQKK